MEDNRPELHDDDYLMIQLQQGCRNAFNILYTKYWEQTYSNAYKRLQDSEEAKDIVQEIFVRIWVNRANSIINFPAYLSVSVRNQIFKIAAKNKNLSPFTEAFENISSDNQKTDSNLLYREFYSMYEALLLKLPPQRQQIFRLRFHEDLPTKIIAAQMRISRKTVQNQLGKAINQLRVILLH
ncbi:MAG: sigma-70 family RNA polymerase sigma factor [Bacteroidetes bacterium]|nr:sigma-70 family RNA polymerase sigma factor [Bacteroidota bacterium]